MRNLIRSLVCGLLVLSSALVHAATLESPAPRSNVSGLGYIAGWKCHHGEVTVRIDGGGPIRMATRMPRADTQSACQGATDNGFITQFNWAFLADGSHTVVAYDNGVEFARSTFTVATFGEEFVVGAQGECTMPDLPSPGETAHFRWNESTQHLELVGGGDGTSPPTFGGASITDQQYTQDTAISALTLPVATGGTGTLSYRLSPALPAGLQFNARTRQLTGTPTTTLASKLYTYTVTDANGATASLTFRLRVAGGEPDIAPANQAAFERFIVGKRIINSDNPTDYFNNPYYDFPSAGRYSVTFVNPASGTYSYRKTGPNTFTLTLTVDGGSGSSCTYQATLTSTTAGTAVNNCFFGRRTSMRIIDSPPHLRPSGFAPADQAAWVRLVAGKRVANVNDSADYYVFSASGRFTYYFHGSRVSGTYSYRKTGPNTAEVAVTSDGGISCTYRGTFTSATTGTAVETCTNAPSRGHITWQIIS